MEILYTGAYTDRQSDQIIDYTDYLFVGQYLPYYICDYYVTYTKFAPGNVPTGNCGAPDMFVDSITDTEVKTHEIRINAPVADNMSLTAGAFSDLELKEHNMFTYPGSPVSDIGFKTNYALTDISVTGIPDHGKSKMYAGAGWHSGRGPYELPVVFVNDVRRTDKQQGIFGELSIDINDDIELTLGARWYDIEVDLEGSANASFGNGFGE